MAKETSQGHVNGNEKEEPVLKLKAPLILSVILIIVAIYFFDYPDSIWQKIYSMASIITLVFIVAYVYYTALIAEETKRQSKAVHQQLELMKGPSLSVGLGRELLEINFGSKLAEIRSPFIIRSETPFNLEAKVSVVFNCGDRVVRHSDSYYNGNKIWNIGANFAGTANFLISDVIKAIGMNEVSLKDGLKNERLEHKIEIGIFSKYKISMKTNSEFRENPPVHYYLDVQRVEVINKHLVAGTERFDIETRDLLVWIWDPESPSVQVINAAWCS